MNTSEFLKTYIEKYKWSVIPVDENKKAVMVWKGCQEKQLTLDEFDLAVKTSNSKTKLVMGIALVTGKLSGVTVIDFDEGSEDLFKDILTPTVRTGGGGKHYYFKYTDKISQSASKELHIDVRNDGGYAILPPSISTKGEYDWIISPDDVELAELPTDFIENYKPSSMDSNWSFDGVDDGGRNETSVHVIGSFVRSMEKDLSLAWEATCSWNNRNKPPIEQESLRATFEWCVKKHGSNHPVAKSNSLEQLIDEGLGAFFDDDILYGINTGYKYFDIKAGGIYAGALTVVAGQTGVGKSLLVMNMIDNILKTNKYKVVYIDLENGERQLFERFIRVRFGMDLDNYKLYVNDIESLKEKARGFSNLKVYFRQDGTRDIKRLMEIMKKESDDGASIFVIDPLQKIDGGSDIKEQGGIVGSLSDFAQQTGSAVILCHHVRKSPTAGGKYVSKIDDISEIKYLDPSIEDVKGGSVITDTAEVVWAVTRSYAAERETEIESDLAKSTTKLKILKCRSNGRALGLYLFFMDINTLRFHSHIESLSFYESNLLNQGDK